MARRPKPDPSMRGYVRHTHRRPASVQIAALEAAGCGEIYVEGRDGETIDAAVRSLREGDTLLVLVLRVVASGSRQITAVLNRVAKAGAVIVEVETGRRSDTVDGLRGMMADALRREGHDTETAKALGVKGAAKRKQSAVDRALKAKADWFGHEMNVEDIAAKYRVSKTTLYTVLGNRPKPPGPKRKAKPKD